MSDTELNGSKMDGKHASKFEVTDDGKLTENEDAEQSFSLDFEDDE